MRPSAKTRLIELLTASIDASAGKSLRSVATELGVSAASLSGFINGRRSLSMPLLKRMIDRLPMSADDRASLTRDLVNGEDYTPLEYIHDIHSVMNSIYFFAMIDLFETDAVEFDLDWIADRLRLERPRAQAIVGELERLGLVRRGKDRTYASTGKKFSIGGDVPRPQMRQMWLSSLEAVRSIVDSLDQDSRWKLADTSSMIFPINMARLDEAKKRVQAFRRSIAEFLASGPKTEVYLLSMNLVPLTNVEASTSSLNSPSARQ